MQQELEQKRKQKQNKNKLYEQVYIEEQGEKRENEKK